MDTRKYRDPARAVMTVNWSAPGGLVSSLLKLELFVDAHNAWTGHVYE